MKKIFTLTFVIISLAAYAQTVNSRFGAVGSYFGSKIHAGGEMVVSTPAGAVDLGIGASVLSVTNGVYTPVYFTAGYSYKTFQVHGDAGKILYSKTENKVLTEGALYIAGGLKYSISRHLYVNAQYSRYTIKSTLNGVGAFNSSNGIAVSAGYVF